MPVVFDALQSSLPLRAAIWISLALFFLTGFADSPFAQSGPGGYGPGGDGGFRPRGGASDRFGPSRGGGRMPSLEAIEGPPSPAIMRDSIGVNSEQLRRYSQLYANHTVATRPLRDSLRTTMQAMRAAFESDDRSVVRERHEAVQQQWKELSQRDKTFDKAVKDVLTKDQQKRYQKWKDEREKAARERWHGERRPAGARGVDAPDGAGAETTFSQDLTS